MDFFEVFPQLRYEPDAALQGRTLRLIAAAALPYDGEAFYFELREERYWVKGPQGELRIGMGGAQVNAESREPLRALRRHLRSAWNVEARAASSPAGLLVLEGERCVKLSGPWLMFPAAPHWVILTPPQLGGSEMPDALAQIVYLLPLRQSPQPVNVVGLVRVAREALPAFLEAGSWTVETLQATPWAEIRSRRPLPAAAELQPVLALRAMQRVWREGLLEIGP
ncbi:MAG TPA: hypothetical protein PKL16_13775 [Anaerolineae bacterium]|nr:hypothetical protein [Anaerolineae bacterium]